MIPAWLLTAASSRTTWIALAVVAVFAFCGCQQLRIHRLQGQLATATARAGELQAALDAAAGTNRRLADQVRAQSAAIERMQADAAAQAARAAAAAAQSWARSTARRRAAQASTERTPQEMTAWVARAVTASP